MIDEKHAMDDRAARQAKVGTVNYLHSDATPSLFRNGEVLTRRDRDGSDAGSKGVDRVPFDVTINNARLLEGAARRTCEQHGFELLDRPLSNAKLDFLAHQDVVGSYYPECAQIVRDATGAAHVFAFDHNIRSAVGKEAQQRIAGGQQVQGPAQMVHGDYTLTSAPQRLFDLTRPPSRNDTYREQVGPGESLVPPSLADAATADAGRFAIINVWRNIDTVPVATHPMALCDAQTVTLDDLVVFEIHYQDRVGENYFSKHADGHRWYFYPAMTRDEALLIKQWDSAGGLARSSGEAADADSGDIGTFSFHTAFVDPATLPDAPSRWSIEVRCLVIYDA